MSTFPVIRAVIVDESPQQRRDARQSIARTGLAGIWDFDRGEEALSILPAVVPAVVIVGRQLEDMTGFEFSRRIRSRKGLSGLPLILLSAEGDLEDLMEAVENGADQYVVVPFRPEDLAQKVEAAIAQIASRGPTSTVPIPQPPSSPGSDEPARGKGYKHESAVKKA